MFHFLQDPQVPHTKINTEKMAFWNKRKNSEAEFATIHEAIEAGNYSATKRFLLDGIESNVQDGRDLTPLHIAAAHGHIEIARLLIENGAEVNFLIDDGGTPLMAASARLKPKMVEYLLSNGADPNKKGLDGRFPLTCLPQPSVVLVDEQLECIRLLIAHGGKVDGRTDTGSTALMKAVWFGNREATEELLKLGANPALRDHRGRTAAMLAFERGNVALAQSLKQRADQSMDA